MSNTVTYTINDIERRVRIVRHEGRYSIEVQYDINDLVFWLPIDVTDDWHSYDDEALKNAIAEADTVIANAFSMNVEDTT